MEVCDEYAVCRDSGACPGESYFWRFPEETSDPNYGCTERWGGECWNEATEECIPAMCQDLTDSATCQDHGCSWDDIDSLCSTASSWEWADIVCEGFIDAMACLDYGCNWDWDLNYCTDNQPSAEPSGGGGGIECQQLPDETACSAFGHCFWSTEYVDGSCDPIALDAVDQAECEAFGGTWSHGGTWASCEPLGGGGR